MLSRESSEIQTEKTGNSLTTHRIIFYKILWRKKPDPMGLLALCIGQLQKALTLSNPLQATKWKRSNLSNVPQDY